MVSVTYPNVSNSNHTLSSLAKCSLVTHNVHLYLCSISHSDFIFISYLLLFWFFITILPGLQRFVIPLSLLEAQNVRPKSLTAQGTVQLRPGNDYRCLFDPRAFERSRGRVTVPGGIGGA